MEAPLVSLDEEFEDLRPCYIEDRGEKSHYFYGSSPHYLEDPSLSELENFSSEIISFKSMEDLVNEFDEKLNVCFRNYNAKTENLAPVKNHLQIQEEEENLQDEEVWDALTDNYIPSISEDWRDPNVVKVLNGNVSDTEVFTCICLLSLPSCFPALLDATIDDGEEKVHFTEELFLCRRAQVAVQGDGGGEKEELQVPLTDDVRPSFSMRTLTSNGLSLAALVDQRAPCRSVLCQGLPGGGVDNQGLERGFQRVFVTRTEKIHEKEEEELNEKSENDSGINEEPLLTADQVIEEIEEMMQNSPDPDEEEEILEEDDSGENSSQADSVLLQEMKALSQTLNNNWSYEGYPIPRAWGLGHMSPSQLLELLDRVEGAIRDYSEELVQQLAHRDELEFEKEVKNSFITVLMEVQNKQKEHRELMKRRRKEKGLSLQSGRIERATQMPLKRFSMEGISNILQTGIRQTFGNSATDKQASYLNTVIPYEKKGAPPSVEDLQMLTNILFAMKEDNEKVPTLLTDYILKGNYQ
ncbi:Fasciculation and elongation protein zeta-1 [Varanus komodoensis]|nr:Fasciculation and elongation protein zeta-1 [Varanus komodoensis]